MATLEGVVLILVENSTAQVVVDHLGEVELNKLHLGGVASLWLLIEGDIFSTILFTYIYIIIYFV